MKIRELRQTEKKKMKKYLRRLSQALENEKIKKLDFLKPTESVEPNAKKPWISGKGYRFRYRFNADKRFLRASGYTSYKENKPYLFYARTITEMLEHIAKYDITTIYDFHRRDLELKQWVELSEEEIIELLEEELRQTVGIIYENLVIFYFGRLYEIFDFSDVILGSGEYPDAEAMVEGKKVKIEFEITSSGFNHDPSLCDLIVCWAHDKHDVPIEVLELKPLVEFICSKREA